MSKIDSKTLLTFMVLQNSQNSRRYNDDPYGDMDSPWGLPSSGYDDYDYAPPRRQSSGGGFNLFSLYLLFKAGVFGKKKDETSTNTTNNTTNNTNTTNTTTTQVQQMQTQITQLQQQLAQAKQNDAQDAQQIQSLQQQLAQAQQQAAQATQNQQQIQQLQQQLAQAQQQLTQVQQQTNQSNQTQQQNQQQIQDLQQQLTQTQQQLTQAQQQSQQSAQQLQQSQQQVQQLQQQLTQTQQQLTQAQQNDTQDTQQIQQLQQQLTQTQQQLTQAQQQLTQATQAQQQSQQQVQQLQQQLAQAMQQIQTLQQQLAQAQQQLAQYQQQQQQQQNTGTLQAFDPVNITPQVDFINFGVGNAGTGFGSSLTKTQLENYAAGWETQQTRELSILFDKVRQNPGLVDTNGDGKFTAAEFQALARRSGNTNTIDASDLGITDPNFRSIQIGVDGSGNTTFNGRAMFSSTQATISDIQTWYNFNKHWFELSKMFRHLAAHFTAVDTNRDGSLSKAEIAARAARTGNTNDIELSDFA